jgi:hypothetical protein
MIIHLSLRSQNLMTEMTHLLVNSDNDCQPLVGVETNRLAARLFEFDSRRQPLVGWVKPTASKLVWIALTRASARFCGG